MPDLTPTTHDWTHEPGGFRVAFESRNNNVYAYIEERSAKDCAIDRHLITWGPANPVPYMRAEVKALFDLGAIDEETANMLLSQLADHD